MSVIDFLNGSTEDYVTMTMEEYYNKTMLLCKTIVFKSNDTALTINRALKEKYGNNIINEQDKSTWKYYLNICGIRHHTDPVIKIISLDTKEEIEFTIENLMIHTGTLEEYQYDSRYYKMLLSLYPEQELLILGVLYPAKMEQCLRLPDFSILTYDKNLVEPYEFTLLSELENWAMAFMERWRVNGYFLTDELYPAALYGIFFLTLYNKVLNLRLKRIGTMEAHSFHIKNYLESHHYLGRYYRFLNRKQVLYLYHNLPYLNSHTGKTNTLEKLIKYLLTERDIGIAEYKITQQDDFSDVFGSYKYKRKPLNKVISNTVFYERINTEQVLEKERDLAINNKKVLIKEVDDKILETTSSVTNTKMLESIVKDYENSEEYPLPIVMFNYWGYLSQLDLYNAYFEFEDVDNNIQVNLNTKEAFLFILYLLSRNFGWTEDIYPQYFVEYIQYETNKTINSKLRNEYLTPEDKTEINDYFIPFTKIKTVNQFTKFSNSIFVNHLNQWRRLSAIEHAYRYVEFQSRVDSLYRDIKLPLTIPELKPSEWMKDKGIMLDNLTYTDINNLVTKLFIKATGYKTDDEKSVRNIQKAMLTIMSKLISYSIQIVSDVNEEPIIEFKNNWVRLANLSNRKEDKVTFSVDVHLHGTKGSAVSSLKMLTENLISDANLTNETYSKLNLNTINNTKPIMDTIQFDYPLPAVLIGSGNYNEFINETSLTLPKDFIVRDLYSLLDETKITSPKSVEFIITQPYFTVEDLFLVVNTIIF